MCMAITLPREHREAYGDSSHRRLSVSEGFVITGQTPRPNGPHGGTWLTHIRATAESHFGECRLFRGRAYRPAVSGAGTGGRGAHHRARSVTPSGSHRTAIATVARCRRRRARPNRHFRCDARRTGVGYGGVVCDVSPRERFEAIRDATRRGLDRLVSVPEAGGL